MKATVITIQFESTSATLETVKNVLTAMGVKFGEKSYEWEEAPKVEEPKKSAPKKDKKAKDVDKKAETKAEAPAPKKSEDDFDRDLYLEMGKRFGVLTKHGVARFARPAIYDAMREYAKRIESGKKDLTKTQIKSIRSELVSLAAKGGEAWMMDMVLKADVQ